MVSIRQPQMKGKTVIEIIQGLVIPFLGTALGSACVFFMKKEFNLSIQRIMTGFAAGVMTAASFWSLLIPSIEQSKNMGRWAFLPSVVGFLCGIAFLLLLDDLIPHLHRNSSVAEGIHARLPKNTMLLLAVTIHNIPEGMAVGVVCASLYYGSTAITYAGVLALVLGIGIQNFPEGAIISMPLKADGMSKPKAFACGVISGAAEPFGAVLTILATRSITPLMPYLLSFAAGAMLYVVVEELIPEMSSGKHSNIGTISFALGFAIMMILDVALG